MQSTSLHVAIIMDGNGRWARARQLPRGDGHRAGADAVRRIVRAAPAQGIGVLTLYAFSADNWRRPPAEVAGLMALFAEALRLEAARAVREGVRLKVIGRRDRLPLPLRAAIAAAEHATSAGRRLLVRLAVDYSARDQLLEAAGRLAGRGRLTRADLGAALGPDVDLLLRTSGERRLSDFLLWESAYAELLFTDRLWPDFDEQDLALAVAEFHRRDRRFGGLSAGGTA